ncbi:chromosome partition protein Smc [Zafaria cholistanensis]|uniref:Chromosome partition protein Smc n=1 Tax=Zafaria cholistanensis TaxID=1682741 RepID=A0A5A7NQ46_9MICC|nr:chromosome segregation protein SMC [Zafaria cholistanensis]GER21938.1 chromosome partition protein Smc [Zafaria cholistanensis]
MHLKSLTVRGFKSFASATVFDFEPGVTAVVGPNGSGKSNVVDALAWVMGEQGAKTLRGGKMEDVIFAGTTGRPPLGRAHVSLTIDNTDGALPIEYAEVTISRTLFRAGGSEYAINGEPARLLDIQELLSDSGLGREMHVIVGQGQLDRILHATADDRRGFIEEAAGILKHRRRREKTVRKLDAMQANLARLQDLTGELRRQLTPLGKQAEVARRAQAVQFEVRDARARLLADDLATLAGNLARDSADEAALRSRQDGVQARLETVRAELASLEAGAARATPAVNAARDTWYRLGAVRERFRSLSALAAERARLLGAGGAQPDPSRDPDRLEHQAARLRGELAEVEEQLEARRELLEEAIEARAASEEAFAEEERRLAALLRAAADRREGLARLSGKVGAHRSRVEAAEGERGRLLAAAADAESRRAAAQAELAAAQEQPAAPGPGGEDPEAALAAARERADALQGRVREVRAREAGRDRDRAALAARLEVLRQGLARRDATEDVLAAAPSGIGGRVFLQLEVAAGHEAAIAAALGPAAEALAADGLDAARTVLEGLRAGNSGRVHLLLADAPAAPAEPEPPAPAVPARTLVRAPAELAGAVGHLLARTAVVADAGEAAAVLAADPAWRLVTRDGDVFTAASAAGGTAAAPSLLETQAAVEETARRLAEAEESLALARVQAGALAGQAAGARAEADAALARVRAAETRNAAQAAGVARLEAAVRQSEAERDRLAAGAEAARVQIEAGQEALAEAVERLDAAQESADGDDEPATGTRDALATAATRARQRELEARLALRGTEEQAGSLRGRVQSLSRAAETERRARAQAEARARVRRRQAAAARAVAAAADTAGRHAEASLELAAAARDRAEAVRTDLEARLVGVRAEAEELGRELASLTDAAHREELARAQQRLRLEALENRAIEELGMTPEHLLEHYGPHLPVPSAEAGGAGGTDKWAALHQEVDADGNPVPTEVPYDRAQQQKRLKRAERDLAALGKVNPLALEEFAALEERHRFLATQLEDLKASRKDLLDIIRDVDGHVQRVFAEAFADTAAQFGRVFARLFPGGEGRLVLTDPSDMLATGIEVEARPAGKKIKRLSLLSGGERSLTAVALLVAIFKARPSPFYVMDEVEAALDDTNLGRLITIFEELRESSQLIVITHQKRTMEIADALYGVTMRGDGVSAVISQRIERQG